MKTISFWTILILSSCQAVIAANNATIIYIFGSAQIKHSEQVSWMRAEFGTKLFEGSQIKTSSQSSVLLLLANGTLRRVKENQTVTALISRKKDTRNPLMQIREFFKDFGNRKRLLAVRSEGAFYSEWVALLNKPSFTPDDLRKSFEIMEFYDNASMSNRIIALLLKTSDIYKYDPGFRLLADRIVTLFKWDVDWQVVLNNEGNLPFNNNLQLQSGDKIQIRYASNMESYYYLFLSSQPQKKSIKTRHLLPSPNMGIRIMADSPVFIPSSIDSFVIDRLDGQEFFWGFACYGPVTNEESLNQLILKVENMIESKKNIAKDAVLNIVPPFCMTAFVEKL